MKTCIEYSTSKIVIFQKELKLIKSQIPESGVREEILEFISNSDKGIIRGMI